MLEKRENSAKSSKLAALQMIMHSTAATHPDSLTVQTLNSARASFGEFTIGLLSRCRCISTSRWWFSHSCTARFTSFKMFLLHSCALVSNSYSVVFAATAT